jgi:hypothetical protein
MTIMLGGRQIRRGRGDGVSVVPVVVSWGRLGGGAPAWAIRRADGRLVSRLFETETRARAALWQMSARLSEPEVPVGAERDPVRLAARGRARAPGRERELRDDAV